MHESTSDQLLRRTVVHARRTTGLPVVFGGPVLEKGLVLSESSGMRTGSLDGLLVAPDQGLGGHAVQMRRPVAVTEYRSAPTISHAYDHQVGSEGLISLVAVPVVTGRRVRAVLYGALRRPGAIGEVAVGQLVLSAQRLGQLLQNRERAADSPVSSSAPTELGRVFDELRELAGRLENHELAAGILAGCDRYAEVAGDGAHRALPRLSPRELDVLALAAVGCGNGDIAGLLSTTPDAVKSHLRQAMRRLGVRTRHAAVSSARAHGLMR